MSGHETSLGCDKNWCEQAAMHGRCCAEGDCKIASLRSVNAALRAQLDAAHDALRNVLAEIVLYQGANEPRIGSVAWQRRSAIIEQTKATLAQLRPQP